MNQDDAHTVLRLLSAGYPSMGQLSADSIDLYVEQLTTKVPDAAIAYAVATDWVTSQMFFPKIPELLDECGHEQTRRANRARALEAGRGRRLPGQVSCARCLDRQMIDWVDESGAWMAAPCPDCDPDWHAYWMAGHLHPDHDVLACDHERCIARSKKRRH